jgi:putative oxidoreductase
MYEGQTAVQIVGQALIAFLFLATGILNAAFKVQQHLDRMVAVGVPFARAALYLGFAMQLVGGAMLLFDYGTDIASPILIVFTVAATVIFHQYWRVEDPIRRHMHFSFIFSNLAIIGGLLVVM